MDNAHHESEQGGESEESHEKGTSSCKRAGDCSLACRPILAGCEPESRCAVEASHGVPLDSLLFAHGETSLCRMADMVIPSNCVERSEPFSLNDANRPLIPLVVYFKRHCKSIFNSV